MRARLLSIFALCGLASCATMSAPSNVSLTDAAANLTGLTAKVLPPANTVVSVHRNGGFGGKDLENAFAAALRQRGFGVSDHTGTQVNYTAAQFDSAILLEIQTQNFVVMRAYQPDASGKLVPVSPLSMGESN